MARKLAFLFALLMAPFLVLGQTNNFPTNGNVTINDGHLIQTGSSNYISTQGPIKLKNYLLFDSDGDFTGGNYYTIQDDPTGNFLRLGYGFASNLTINSSGNIGIGTDSPDSKLHLYISGGPGTYPTNSAKGDVVQSIRSNNNGIEIGNSRGFNDRKAWILARHSSVSTLGKYYSALHIQPDIGDKSQYRGIAIGYDTSMNIPLGTHLAVNGRVGIGTLNPDSELTVKGKIHAEEVKVDLSVPGPDYVFKEGYDLKSLEEVQNYIDKHGHLPNIPSAQEMEENGISLGEMNMKLLEKVEELTLYTLKQEEKIQDGKRLLAIERRTNKEQEERLSKLEQLLIEK